MTTDSTPIRVIPPTPGPAAPAGGARLRTPFGDVSLGIGAPRVELPPADSLAFYATLAVVGVVGAVEWPALALAAAAQALVDRRVGHLERRVDRLSAHS